MVDDDALAGSAAQKGAVALPLEHHHCHAGISSSLWGPLAETSRPPPRLHGARQLLQHRVAFVARHPLVAFFGHGGMGDFRAGNSASEEGFRV